MKIKKLVCVFIAALMLAVCFVPAYAVLGAVPRLTFTINYSCDGVYIPGAVFKMYFVAAEYAGEFKAVGDFAKFPVRLNGLDTEGAVEAAEALAGLAVLNGILPEYTGKTDENGMLTFPGKNDGEMKPGVYLLTGERRKYNGEAYTITPTLYYLPSKGTDGKPVYDVTVIPKGEHTPVHTGEKTDVRAIKVWQDKGYEYKRPEKLSVVLFKDGKYYASAELEKGSGWIYTWHDLEADHDYTAVEKTVNGYSYSVRRNGNTFILRNNISEDVPATEPSTDSSTEPSTDSSTEPSTDSSTVPSTDSSTVPSTDSSTESSTDFTTNPNDSTTNPNEQSTAGTTNPGENTTDHTETATGKHADEIPKTGLLMWPITVFSVLGILFVIIGWVLIRKNNYEENT